MTRKASSRRDELQRELGSLGGVLPRLPRGTVECPAQGWYAELAPDGRRVFLGDHMGVALARIGELQRELGPPTLLA